LLTDQTQRSFLAEDIPQQKMASLHGTMELGSCLDKIGDLFDYNWSVHGECILLRKRVRAKGEYPQLSAPELRASIQEMLAIARNVYEPLESLPSVQEGFISLVDALNADELQYIAAGNHLPLARVNPLSQRLAKGIIYSQLFQSFYFQSTTPGRGR
jgi:hypothetical protein